ncbi:response regulator [Acidobacteriota bacterium]
MSHKIVVIDDDKVTVKLLEKRFLDSGWEVFTAFDGEEGFKQIQAHLPAVVVSDTLIPKLDGLQLAQKVKKDPRLAGIRFILISAVYKTIAFRQDIIDAGVDAFVEKPLDMPRLMALIKKYLNP